MAERKSYQAGVSHNYPTHRKSYTTSRKGVGGRKRKSVKNVDENKSKSKLRRPTYFDDLLKSEKAGMLLTPTLLFVC